ncbi:response regulator [Empedobacter falsenii]|uniref:Response regulator n=1 Tax=Empedobacter falsenii TaxID=343874 RepID=A0AAW7DIK8_9FLAO|nr:response regulator [Empedobacter falsenii]MDM1551650.1 response regulator [Empedobacter falsenii]
MGRFLHLYRADSLINESIIFSIDINEFENSYSSIYDSIVSQVDESDAIIIDENCFEIKSKLFEFITYFRINKCKNWDIPIFIFKDKLSNKDAFDLLKNDFNNIIKTKRFDIISSKDLEKDVLTGKISLFRNLDIKLKESLIFEEFIKTVKVEGSNLNNHSIANEWAIYRWAKTLNISDSEIEKITEKIQNDLYFKYLHALYPISPSSVISDKELKIPFSGKVPQILYVDDEADKGWYEIFCNILYDKNKFDFDYLGNELKGISQEEIIELVFNKVVGKETDLNTKNAITDIVLLDFRLHQSDFTEANIKEVTGYKILKKIKDYNPGIQVIVISATNKIWNLQALQEAGVDGFILKENVENSQELNFTNSSIKSFVENINKANSLVFLKDVYNKFTFIKSNILELDSSINVSSDIYISISNFLDISFNLLKQVLSDEKYLNYSFIQLFLIVELIASNDLFIEENNDYVEVFCGGDKILIQQPNNSNLERAIIFTSNHKYELQNSYLKKDKVRLDVNFRISSILIFRLGFQNSSFLNWSTIRNNRNTKAAHFDKSNKAGNIEISDILEIIEFIEYLTNKNNIDNVNIDRGLIMKPITSQSLSALQNKYKK